MDLSIKTSSRSGRFKKKLVPESSLEKEALFVQERMAPFLELYQQQKLSASEFTAIHIITVLSFRYPTTWLGSKTDPVTPQHQLHTSLDLLRNFWEPNIQKRLQNYGNIGEIFQNFAFRSTPLKVNRSVLQWSLGNYSLELMFRIPSSAEVLDQQKVGRRCVTVFLEAEQAKNLILGERDSLGFCMHDLIHADHFYHHNECYESQLGFYGLLDECLRENHFADLLHYPEFSKEFDYFISDMNAYAIHLLKCLKSSLIYYHPTGEDYFLDWIKKLNLSPAEEQAFLDLNTTQYHESRDPILLNLLQKFKSSSSASHSTVFIAKSSC